MSRELDARVAEKLLGWIPNVDFPVWREDLDLELDECGSEYATQAGLYVAPRYSTDVGLAMGLLDQFESFSICTNKHVATVVVICNKGYYHEANYESIPIAICLAALRAVGDNEWVVKHFYDESLESEAMLLQGIEDAKAGRISPLDEDLLADDKDVLK